tara:strand:+ start:281 stop:1192 length:912 start_codon:yes stop_codon:yes gene_type:complete
MPFSLKILPAILATVTISLQAQMGPPIPAGETVYAGEVLGVFQGSADMNAGGDMSIHRLGFKFGAIRGLDGGSSIGGGLCYTMLGYRFEGVPALGGFNPWEDIDQLQLSLQYRYAIDRKSSLFLMPSVTSSGESGASFSDSIEFGAIFGYTKTFSRELTLGIGGGAFYGLEDTSGFPVIFVYWQMADNWRLSNPFRPGPSGPAGLEIVYTGLTGWEIGFGGGYRVSRFALNDVGPAPNGFGQNEGAAMFVRASREFQSGGNLDLYVGTVVGGELELEDSGGRLLARTDYDPAVLFALAFTQRW